jgi:hypothetical protein
MWTLALHCVVVLDQYASSSKHSSIAAQDPLLLASQFLNKSLVVNCACMYIDLLHVYSVLCINNLKHVSLLLKIRSEKDLDVAF